MHRVPNANAIDQDDPELKREYAEHIDDETGSFPDL